MSGLSDLLEALARRPGVDLAVLLSPDGLTVSHAGTGDVDSIAALAATALRHAERLASGAGREGLQRLVLEGEAGALVLSLAHEGHWLLLRLGDDADFGDLLYDLRRHQPALSALL
ncbi:MAG: roadblock/LC7 domain-containing protein [Gemmatimonadales bacterium]|jgi:predicted regulator of Ras-like GTPase activity (Roadblock/LC7/MglB family)|nr:roadblock/LC7 domain-containing protein [Gemmatimonadales bacterium]